MRAGISLAGMACAATTAANNVSWYFCRLSRVSFLQLEMRYKSVATPVSQRETRRDRHGWSIALCILYSVFAPP